MNRVKGLIAALIGGLSSLIGVLAVTVLLLVGCNVIDYLTGLMAAGARKQALSSYKSIRGIAKKVCMWMLVIVGAIVDELLVYASASVGLTLPFTFLVACVVCLWLICNELLSILENISDTGVMLPPFLKKIVKYIKKSIEDAAEVDEKDGGKK